MDSMIATSARETNSRLGEME